MAKRRTEAIPRSNGKINTSIASTLKSGPHLRAKSVLNLEQSDEQMRPHQQIAKEIIYSVNREAASTALKPSQ
ncbi:unnamed protein product [Protopolystoma xenopodis]|uniref:Uncharacterized protein n=1 Tax=Protopolystoma xenopodis TaxID=117903 RepID=A0A3S5APJ7_9PLAT|nr:unnamed protein product [Protopolystoma xenopodis]